MNQSLKKAAVWLARRRVVRSLVGSLIYPNVIRYLLDEIRPDIRTRSGVVEAIAWKVHSYIVLNEELRVTGVDCSEGDSRSDSGTRAKLIDEVLSWIASVPGSVLEFGVAAGDSLCTFGRRCPEREVVGFDSFEGLPEDWWTRPKGTFKAAIPDLSETPNVRLVVGLFDQTVPEFLKKWDGRCALVHVDCDLYKSTLACLGPLLPRLQVGTVVLFDEYYNYEEFALNEWLAWRQLSAEHGILAQCVGYDGRRAAFRVTGLGRVSG